MTSHQFPPAVISLIKKQFEKHESVEMNDGILDLIMGVKTEAAKRPIKSRLGPNPKFGGTSCPGTSVGNILAGGELPRANENKNPLFRIFKTGMAKKNETVTISPANKLQGGGTAAAVNKGARKQVLSRKQLDDELDQYLKQRGQNAPIPTPTYSYQNQKKTPITTTAEELDKELDEYLAVAKMKKQLKEKTEQVLVLEVKDGSEPMEIATSHTIF